MDIERYFQCLGPQDISLGNFQGTDRPTLMTQNWSVRFLSVARTRVHPMAKAVPRESARDPSRHVFHSTNQNVVRCSLIRHGTHRWD